MTVDGDLVGDINNSAGSVAHPAELVPCTSCIKKELSFWKPLLLNRGNVVSFSTFENTK